MTLRRIVASALICVLAQSCGDKKSESEDPVPLPAGDGGGGGGGAVVPTPTTGKIALSAVARNLIDTSEAEDHDLLSLKKWIRKVEISTDGASWVTVLSEDAGREFDVVAGTGEFLSGDLAPGTYNYIYVETTRKRAFKRKGTDCDQGYVNIAAIGKTYTTVSTIETVAAAAGQSFAYPFFESESSPTLVKTDLSEERYSHLANAIVVEAGGVVKLKMALSPYEEVSGYDCDSSVSAEEIIYTTADDAPAGITAALAPAAPYTTDIFSKSYFSSCTATGAYYTYTYGIFYPTGMHKVKAFTSDSACSVLLFRLYEWASEWGVGEAITGAATGVRKFNYIADASVNIQSAAGAIAANALSFCGKTDWVSGEWRTANGFTCETRVLPAAEVQHFGSILFTGTTVQFEGAFSGANDGTTIAKRNPIVDSLVLTRSN